jgi:hypothetical protein
VGFWCIAPFVPTHWLFDIVNSASIAGAIGVIVMYYSSVAKKLGSWLWPFYNYLSGPHYFILGVCGFCTYILARHTYNSYWRWVGKPDWMQDHIIVAFMVFFAFCVSCVHLLSRDMKEGEIPSENWRWIGITLAAAIFLALTAIEFLDPAGPMVIMRLP